MRFTRAVTAYCSIALMLMINSAHANDGFGGLAATGLEFGQTEAVTMQDEDLYISPTEIRVAYVFKNLTERDVSGEVIFPLPPIRLSDMIYSQYNLPDDLSAENLVGFHAEVAGVEVPVQIDRIAVIEPEWSETTPSTQQYDAPGKDVSDLLRQFGLPFSVDAEAISGLLLSRGQKDRDTLVALGLAQYDPAGDDYAETAYPLWSVVLRYHWTQTFPAGKELRIAHRYQNYPSGGIFQWIDPPETGEYMSDLAKTYCIDAPTSKAIAKRLTRLGDGETYVTGSSFEMNYVLRTANSWAGPIRHFKLTVDKAKPENVVSLCVNGIRKTGATTFVMEKTNYSPEQDLRILVVQPLAP